jgi:GPH family glycoside/pentoside/hexuronide:cation symporter
MMILLGSTIVFIPFWVWIAKIIGKKTALSVGMLTVGLCGMLIFLFGQRFGMGFMFAIMLLAGIGLSPTYVLPWAIVPDTIDYDTVRTGQRKEGTYYGLWTFSSKIGQALAAFLIGNTLFLSRYAANQTVQPDTAIFGIRLLFGPVMTFFYIVGGIVVLFYPINRSKYDEIRTAIDRMQQ